jgi:hypothetical protein
VPVNLPPARPGRQNCFGSTRELDDEPDGGLAATAFEAPNLIGLEADATTISFFELILIPGLLQTEAYARATTECPTS